MSTEQFKNTCESILLLIGGLQSVLKDKTIPLKDRWSMLDEAEELGAYVKIKRYYFMPELMKQRKVHYFCDLEIEKYRTISLIELIDEWMTQYQDPQDPEEAAIIAEFGDDADKISHLSFTDEELDQMREEILQSGYTGFIMDW